MCKRVIRVRPIYHTTSRSIPILENCSWSNQILRHEIVEYTRRISKAAHDAQNVFYICLSCLCAISTRIFSQLALLTHLFAGVSYTVIHVSRSHCYHSPKSIIVLRNKLCRADNLKLATRKKKEGTEKPCVPLYPGMFP